jgi:single-strand DNA-binding protein
MNGNTMTAIGNLTKDVELKFLKDTGKAFARFSIADNYSWPNKNGGERESKVSYIDCIAWGQIAENIAESLAKGDRVIVYGRIDQQSWETEDGERRSKLELDVDGIGAELRFATAKVEKVNFDSNRERPSQGTKRQNRADQTFADDEEPF